MPSIPDLPSELTVQIMCQCQDIKTVLRLSATCRSAYQSWCGNAAYIVSAACSFTHENLDDALSFARLEASTSEMACLTTIDQNDRNSTVRCYLPSINRTAFASSVLELKYKVQLDEQRQRGAFPGRKSLNDFIDALPDYCESFLIIRRLAVGYEHLDALPAAYTALHETPDEVLDGLSNLVRLLRCYCRYEELEQMGIEWHEPEESWWEYQPHTYYNLPLAWEFAIATINLEHLIRFNDLDDDEAKGAIEEHHEFFEKEIVARMYGVTKPWEKRWSKPTCDQQTEAIDEH